MAYLEPEILTCPGCSRAEEMIWVIGEGPGTKPGQGPDYVDVMDAAGWVVTTVGTAPYWQGEIKCPVCDGVVREVK